MHQPLKAVFAASVLLVLGGCATTLPPPSTSLVDQPSSNAAWHRVLQQHVDSEGRVDFAAVARSPQDLNEYVGYLAKHGPKSRPGDFDTPDKILGYYLDSYNALAMYGVIQLGIPKDFDSFFKRANFFKFTKYTLDGEIINLYDYENDVIRKVGDPRVHFALNCMSVGCPRLPQTPFSGPNLQATLHTAALEFFNSDTHVVINDAKKTARISQILQFFTEDFVNEQQSPSLLAYVNRFRSKPIPPDYEVEFIPYDWTVNRQ